MLERAVRGALMNSLSFMWGFYFLLSAAPSLVATRAVVSALPQLIATSYFSRHGCSLRSGRWREPYRSGMWSSVRRLLGGASKRWRPRSAMAGSSLSRVWPWSICSPFWTSIRRPCRDLCNGNDIREFDPAELQRRFAVVFQDCVRYALTARENVPRLPLRWRGRGMA